MDKGINFAGYMFAAAQAAQKVAVVTRTVSFKFAAAQAAQK